MMHTLRALALKDNIVADERLVARMALYLIWRTREGCGSRQRRKAARKIDHS